MFPFFKSKRNPPQGAPSRRVRSLAELTGALDNLERFRRNDVAIKFWLPEPAYDALESMSDEQGVSLSTSLRIFLAVHCYGAYTMRETLKAAPELFGDPGHPLFSRRPPPEGCQNPSEGYKTATVYFVPELGKNVAPVKLWLPTSLRDDVTVLAEHASLPLSQYCREIVVSRLLGHGTLPMRPAMLDASPSANVEAWCSDEIEALDMRRVSEEEFDKNRFGERRSEEVPR